MFRTSMILAVAAMLAVSGTAAAEPATAGDAQNGIQLAQMGPGGGRGPMMGGRQTMRFRMFDTNGDGAVSAEEFQAAHQDQAGMFDLWDANEDDALTVEEFTVRGGPMKKAQFQAMDGDGDGKVTRAEFGGHAAAMFPMMDANGDGRLTADEMPGGRR